MKNNILTILITCCIINLFAGGIKLVSPINEFKSPTFQVKFEWNPVVGQSSYKLLIAEDEGFTNILQDINVNNTSTIVSFNALSDSVYWKVISNNANGFIKSDIYKLGFINPSQNSNIFLWLAADSNLVLNPDSTISAWNNIIPNGINAVQTNSLSQPQLKNNNISINGQASVFFDGTNDLMKINSGGTVGSAYVVCNWDGAATFPSFNGLITKQSISTFDDYMIIGDVGKSRILDNNYFSRNGFLSINNTLTFSIIPNQNYFKLISGRRITSLKNFLNFNIGKEPDFIDSYWKGNISEIIISTSYEKSEEDSINTYLLNKYAPPITIKDTIIGTSFCTPISFSAPNNYVEYLWSNGANTLSANLTPDRKYSITTKDVFGFSSTTSFNVFPYRRLNNATVYLCQGDTLKLDLQTPIGFTALWNTGANTTQINITQTGQYTVKVTDANNCFVYDTINVIIDNPALSPTPNIANNLTLCEGEKLFLTTPTAFDSIHWSTGANTNFITVTSPGAYSVYGITSSGCVINKNFNVTIAGKAPTAQFAVAPACQNAALAFTDSSKVPAGNTIQSWNWTFSNNSTSSVQNPSTTFSNLGTQTASLKIKTNVGCTDSIAKTFVVNRNPTPSFYNLLSCEGMPTIFADQTIANAAAVTDWSWNFGGLGISNGMQNPGFSFPAAGNYLVTLKATNSNGCSDTISRQVAVNSSPNANFSFDSVCGKTPVNLKFLATVQAPSVIPDINWGSWDFGDGTIETAIRNPQHIYNEPGTYDVKLVVKSSNQCLDTVVKQIKVFDFPVVDFTISPTQCVGKSIQFTDISATPDGTPISKWNWYFSGLATDTIQHPKYTFNSQGNYTIQLTAQNTVGCSNTKLRSIAVSSPPIPKFTFSPQNGLPPLNVNYVNQSATNGNYLWNYGDGGPFIAGYNPPPHVYTAIGTYPIKLVATDFRGCTDTLTKFILVDRAYLDGVMASISLIPTSGDFYKVQVSIINNSNVEITALGLSLQLGGGAEIRENWTGSLLPGQTTVYLFNGELRAGDNSIPVVCASIDNVNNNATENRTDNNTTCKEIKVGGFDILTIFPNPAYDNNINFGVMLPAAGKVNIRFVDVLGQQMYQHDFDGVKGYNQFAMPIGMLNATVYVAEVSFDGEVVRKKFMRKNR
ncbi:MAG: PKD domain-containing protein [Chitinophagales bacterium]